MPSDKSEKISISLPEDLLNAIDQHTDNRSAYFARLAERDLESAGLIGPTAAAMAEAVAIVRDLGPAVALEALRKAKREI